MPQAVGVLTRIMASLIVIMMLCWATATWPCSRHDVVYLAVYVLRIALLRLSHASVSCHVESHPRIVVRSLAQSMLPRSGPGSASLSV